MVVCGCGKSALAIAETEGCLSIGISDIGRLFTPDYLVVQDYEYEYVKGRYAYILTSAAKYIFSPNSIDHIDPSRMIGIRMGDFCGTDYDFKESSSLPYSQTSMHLAISLAIYMGANPIGVLGLDLTDDYFFATSGPHPLSQSIDVINSQFSSMNAAVAAMGVCIYNLSAQSRITSFARLSPAAFVAL